MNDRSKLRHYSLHAAALAGFAVTLATLAGCKSNAGGAQTSASTGSDPADANLAQPYTGGATGGYSDAQGGGATTGPRSGGTRVMGQSQSYNPASSGESYETQTPAPIIRQNAPSQYYPVPQSGGGNQASYTGDPDTGGGNYTDAEAAGEQALAETDQAPPPLPEYDQPPAPADNYIWNPGYWNYASTGYYFVPGIWCAPPFYGALWTPPYWGYYNNRYLFHRGYWGPHIGYYGGVNYGFGYVGTGYFGGYWQGHDFFYNRAVTNVNIVNVHNVYQHTVVYNNQTYGPHPENRVSYNGGPGGLRVQPRPEELAALHEAHYAPLPVQQQNRQAAASNRSQFFAANQGRPAQAFAARPAGAVSNIAAMPREGAFNHPSPSAQPSSPGRPGELNRSGSAAPSAVANGHNGAPNTPAFNNDNRPGEPNRPGAPTGTAAVGNRPSDFSRPNPPNAAAGSNTRPGEFNRGSQPASNNSRPASTQPTAPPQSGYSRPATPAQPGYNRPATPVQPGYSRPATPAQPGYNNARPPAEASRPTPPSQPALQPRPAYTRPAPTSSASPAANPLPPAGRPAQITAQPQTRPTAEEQRPAPSLPAPARPQPQVIAPHPGAPAPAAAPHRDEPHPAPAANPHPH